MHRKKATAHFMDSAKSRIFVLPSQEKCLTLTVRATHLISGGKFGCDAFTTCDRLHKKTSFCEALTLGSVVRRVVCTAGLSRPQYSSHDLELIRATFIGSQS
jgi:hypothetical protein